MKYIPNPDTTEPSNIHGYWTSQNDAHQIATPSSFCNFQEDAIVAQLTEDEKNQMEIHTGQDLRDRRIDYLAAHPDHDQQAAQHYQMLLDHAPSALMRGGDFEQMLLPD